MIIMAIYALSDIHGYYSVYEKVKAMLKPEDIVYFLGDAGDRGPQSWKTITAIYNDPQFIYLKGNHEDMLVNFIKNYYGLDDDWSPNDEFYAIYKNGGSKTISSLFELPKEEQMKWYINLRNLPEIKIIQNDSGKSIWLCHAGCTPGKNRCDYLWDRIHFYDIWDDDKPFDDVFVVHRHTPVYYIGDYINMNVYKNPKPKIYANGHKINIDLGTYNTNLACLLNLDDFSYEIIKANEY